VAPAPAGWCRLPPKDACPFQGEADDAPGEGGEYERPVSMPRSARPAQQTPSAPADDYGQGITDDDVPF